MKSRDAVAFAKVMTDKTGLAAVPVRAMGAKGHGGWGVAVGDRVYWSDSVSNSDPVDSDTFEGTDIDTDASDSSASF